MFQTKLSLETLKGRLSSTRVPPQTKKKILAEYPDDTYVATMLDRDNLGGMVDYFKEQREADCAPEHRNAMARALVTMGNALDVALPMSTALGALRRSGKSQLSPVSISL